MSEREQGYDAQTIMRIGVEAQQLLNSQVFGMAYGAVLEDLQRRFFDTEPGHTRTLEEIRREGNALAKVITQLNRAVKQAEMVLEQQNQGGNE